MNTFPIVLIETWLQMVNLLGHENKPVRKAASRNIREIFGSKEIALMYVDQFYEEEEYKHAS
jgi:hypothetical protein